MVLMQFTDISNDEKNTLLDIAKKSISYGLKNQCALPVDTNNYRHLLQADAATFVTLHLNHRLRGCIGTLEAHQPLITDVSEHAFAAAFQDPRFPKVTKDEANQLEIHISILTPAEPMSFSSEKDLLEQIKPGIDGLILQDEFHKGTFLPSVWDQLQKPEDFLNHLKVKAGLNQHDWHDGIKISRYKTISIGEDQRTSD